MSWRVACATPSWRATSSTKREAGLADPADGGARGAQLRAEERRLLQGGRPRGQSTQEPLRCGRRQSGRRAAESLCQPALGSLRQEVCAALLGADVSPAQRRQLVRQEIPRTE